jgi:hypothetical protein
LHPSTPILFTGELNFTIFTQSFDKVRSLALYGINGVSVYPWPVLTPSSVVKVNLVIHVSTIDFYISEKPTEYACSPKLIPDPSFKNSTSLFSSVDSLRIGHGTTYNVAQQLVCPHVFRTARLSSLSLSGQVDSFLFVNLLQFNQSNLFKDNITSIDSSIFELTITNSYNYKVDQNLVHPLVFEKLTQLYIYNTIASIQAELFIHLKNLFFVQLYLDRVGNFFHQVGIEWMANIGLQSKRTSILNISSIDTATLFQDSFYGYPDCDFCIFAPFLNYTQYSQITLGDPVLGCTLTFMWLKSVHWTSANGCNSSYGPNNASSVKTMLKHCELTGNKTNVEDKIYSDYYQTKILNMLFLELVPFVLIPCFCFIGMLLNLKIIKTLKDNEKKELKEDFYKYMSSNAKFNCLYCLIFAFYPMTSCNWNASYTFCSKIYTTQFVQYFKIVMMAYFGEVFKMSANVSYIMMTLNRYLLIGKDHAPWLVSIAKLEFKWVIRGSLIFSALINIGHGWEYQAIETYLIETNYPINFYYSYSSYINGFSYSNYPFASQSLTYFYFSMVYFVINFGFFFILSTIIEIKIVRQMHKELKEKRDRLLKMNTANLSPSSTSTKMSHIEDDDKTRKEEDKKKEQRIIIMVVLNSIFNFFLRAPADFLFWMQKLTFCQVVFSGMNGGNIKIGLSMPGFISFITDIGYLTFIVSFSTNFVIFYFFNSKFNEAVVFFPKSKPKVNK